MAKRDSLTDISPDHPQPQSSKTSRLTLPLQSTGRVGKSTAIESLYSWALWAGIDAVALDADGEHQTLSKAFPDVTLFEAASKDASAFMEFLQEVASRPGDAIFADFPAQATSFLLERIAAVSAFKTLAAEGVKTTVLLFPADDRTAQQSMAQVVAALGSQVDYLLIKNPARFTTASFDGSKMQGRLSDMGAKELRLPVLTAPTLDAVRQYAASQKRNVPLADAAPHLPSLCRIELESWINTVRAQVQEDDLASLLVPDAGLLKKRVTPVVPVATHAVNEFDPFG